jgi:toxin co-regulated pilus biosynthesis outer membrane protein C
MKNKLLVFCLSAMLPGCAHYFDQKYDLKSEYNQMPQVVEADDIKTRPYQKYDAAFLGKRIEYNAKTQQLLSQNVNIESYEPIDLPTLLESVAAQTGISYRINDSLPNSEKTGSQAVPLQAHSINFNGTFEEFMRYISVLYDVSSTLDHNNVLTTSLYETYAIKLDFYGQNNKFEASLDLSSNEATAEGGLIAKSETKFESTFWEDVKDMAEKYVSSGIYSLFKDASILTFTARPSEHKTLSQILKKYQTDNSRQFIVSYKVFVLDKRKIMLLSAPESSITSLEDEVGQRMGQRYQFLNATWEVELPREAIYVMQYFKTLAYQDAFFIKEVAVSETGTKISGGLLCKNGH